MIHSHEPVVRGARLRRAMRLSFVAAVVWAAGNALLTTTLIVFLAQEYGAEGREVGLLLAAPALVGLLRLFTPALVDYFGGLKRLCLVTSIVSYLVMSGIPLLAFAGVPTENPRERLSRLLLIYCVSQLLEQIGTVALWTWLGELMPRRWWGRFFGRRTLLQLIVVVVMLVLGAAASEHLKQAYPERPVLPHAVLTAVGTSLMLLAMLPLALVPDVPHRARRRESVWSQLTAPLRQRASRRLLAYGCWFAFFNGLTSAPQNLFPKGVLKLSVRDLLGMQAVMRLGQAAVSAVVGPWSDRRGNRPVLVVSQIAVGLAPLFYLAASPEHPYRIVGAWILWSAYAGINICLPNLTMRLAQPGGRAAHLAAYYAYTSLFLTLGTLGGGELFDYVRRPEFSAFWAASPLHPYAAAFALACVTRTAGALLLLRVEEPC